MKYKGNSLSDFNVIRVRKFPFVTSNEFLIKLFLENIFCKFIVL